ncbi:LOW QUALITY PROTEIN: MYG1 exonuclease-like [Homalodisca vitripennis]|uniref:LOW QUALITY PROTEIN: MYG1 exonuclease-like n=1 Tax=Homalodisca vitripennis TaxID=197043 RepID=UPI001EE9EE55|nr:LOW QUALITY PROTEIN: MYG1 exonuclease-like [Homalodisca vitripennis]
MSVLGSLKRLKKSPIKIGTHNGVFHCDEVLGTYMLQLIIPDSVVVRSRSSDVLKECDIVIDVGDEYNPSKHLFDHHQRGFNESVSSIMPGKQWSTKLSSAGLVYCHFGKEVIKKILGDDSLGGDKLDAIFDHVYEDFIQEIDAIDNGFPMFDSEPRYRITTNLSSRVNQQNKQWNSSDDFNEEEAFTNAQKYVGSEFESKVKRAENVWWPARKIVSESISNVLKTDPSGHIIELKRHCPWKEHFFNLEKEMNLPKDIYYVIFSDSHDNWRVQAVSLNSGSYICRIFLPEEWQGLRDEELSRVANIDGCIFVHHTGFIGGNKTRKGAMEMAVRSIAMWKNKSCL